MTSLLTESARLAVRVDNEACWEADDTPLETRPVGADLGRPDGADVHIERTLSDVLAAVRDGHDVLARLLRLVDAFGRELVDLSESDNDIYLYDNAPDYISSMFKPLAETNL